MTCEYDHMVVFDLDRAGLQLQFAYLSLLIDNLEHLLGQSEFNEVHQRHCLFDA